jgi:hypothetical protein
MRVLTVGTGLAVLLACALLQGRWSDRWGSSAPVEAGVARLAQVPSKVGDWEGADQVMDAGSRRAAGGAGDLFRKYTDRRTGHSLLVYLVCGRAGRVSTHTPDVCYATSGYDPVGDAERLQVNSGGPAAGEFRMMGFRPHALKGGDPLHVYWSWGASGKWQAPATDSRAASPRLVFAGQPVLFKLYVVAPAEGERPADNNTARDFIRDFLPAVNQALFPET